MISSRMRIVSTWLGVSVSTGSQQTGFEGQSFSPSRSESRAPGLSADGSTLLWPMCRKQITINEMETVLISAPSRKRSGLVHRTSGDNCVSKLVSGHEHTKARARAMGADPRSGAGSPICHPRPAIRSRFSRRRPAERSARDSHAGSFQHNRSGRAHAAAVPALRI